MKLSNIISVLEKIAPLSLQEDYDNAGLITGNPNWECTGIMLTLDCTEEVISEAKEKNCNMIVAHHPILFKGLKKINGNNYVERAIILAIKNDIALYACHTNVDNTISGVNGKIADKLGLVNRKILQHRPHSIQKLTVFVPEAFQAKLETALFAAGAGEIGNYSQCSFVSEGIGSFLPGSEANPVSGEKGVRNLVHEKKIEIVFPSWAKNEILKAMKANHPYEEVAHEVSLLENEHQEIGAGIIGELPQEMEESIFLENLSSIFNIKIIKHTSLRGLPVKKVALCGGSGSFLTRTAIVQKADIYVTSDIKYHEFFDAEGKIVLADIGHYESEQFTIELFAEVLRQNFPNFAILKTEVNTNPVRYFVK